LVRRVTGDAWHPAKDNLVGTETYGAPCGPSDACTFSTKFDTVEFTEFRFATGDGELWMVMKKEEVYSAGANENKQIESSYLSATPTQAKMYNRSGAAEDPWLSAVDHGVATQQMLYGENSHTAHHLTSLANHNGANVFIR
jgi:hypothetical protein